MKPKPFVIAHISDLHVSTFGDTFHDRARMVRRTAQLADTSPHRFDVAWEEGGWRVLRQRAAKKAKLQLVDPDGYAHPIPTAGSTKGLLDPVERAAAKACRLEARRAATLSQGLPTDGALAVLLSSTPKNSNLRFLRAARSVVEADVDAIILTGDITDDGDGYELIESAFAPWIKRGRLFAIPGNHDLYLFPLAGSGRPRPTQASKREAWQQFASRIGLEIHTCGAWTKSIDDGDMVLVGLDSCARRQRAFFRQNGSIGPAQLEFLRQLAKTPGWKNARHRLVAFHHHVVPLPHGVGLRAPTEIGMRLDDGKEFARTLNEIDATLVMHGHRHVSEARHPAGCSFELVAAPSFTLGCKSGDPPSFWKLEFDNRGFHKSRVRIPVEAIEQQADPEEAGEAAEAVESETAVDWTDET